MMIMEYAENVQLVAKFVNIMEIVKNVKTIMSQLKGLV